MERQEMLEAQVRSPSLQRLEMQVDAAGYICKRQLQGKITKRGDLSKELGTAVEDEDSVIRELVRSGIVDDLGGLYAVTFEARHYAASTSGIEPNDC